MTREARTAVARRASTARWIRNRFGSPSFATLGFPGGDLVDEGLADLADNKVTIASLLVSLGSNRLRREGIPLSSTHAEPEDRLYELLSRTSGELAHARYNAYRRQLSSFADACARMRLARKPHAT
jgi:hypothetical protein